MIYPRGAAPASEQYQWRQGKVHGELCKCQEYGFTNDEPCYQIVAAFDISELPLGERHPSSPA